MVAVHQDAVNGAATTLCDGGADGGAAAARSGGDIFSLLPSFSATRIHPPVNPYSDSTRTRQTRWHVMNGDGLHKLTSVLLRFWISLPETVRCSPLPETQRLLGEADLQIPKLLKQCRKKVHKVQAMLAQLSQRVLM